jgi:hypothetical protein
MAVSDPGLDRLLDLDGFLAEVGGGFWVKIVARRIPPDMRRPHGVAYALTLHKPEANGCSASIMRMLFG